MRIAILVALFALMLPLWIVGGAIYLVGYVMVSLTEPLFHMRVPEWLEK